LQLLSDRYIKLLVDRIDHLIVDRTGQPQDANHRIIVAIDGNSTAGKSSLAAYLKETFSCSAISMDHFFLRPEQRTPERLSEPGGNIDYDRFIDEVIKPLKSGDSFSYNPYDCKSDCLGDPICIDSDRLIVIEGVYCMHPLFFSEGKVSDTYDITVFLHVNEDEQKRRLLARNPFLYERFINEWVPMENMYFDNFKIKEKCDFLIHTIFPS